MALTSFSGVYTYTPSAHLFLPGLCLNPASRMDLGPVLVPWMDPSVSGPVSFCPLLDSLDESQTIT